MFGIILNLVSLVATAVSSGIREPSPPSEWSAHEQLPLASGCTVSHVGRYDMARGRNHVALSTSSLDDFEGPRIPQINSTVGEQWEFDGISGDGTRSFMLGFYRDSGFSFLGTGNLRVYLDYAFANGSRYTIVEYAEDSVVESCPESGTRGTWKGNDWVYSFLVSPDMSRAKVEIDNPEAKFTITMTSISPPRYPDNNVWPSDQASVTAVPYFFWTEPIPVADLTFDATIRGEVASWGGMAGHERLWSAFSWYTCIVSMTAVRIHVGPFSVSFVEFQSALEQDLIVPSMLLVKDGTKIFSSRSSQPSGVDDYAKVQKLYGGNGSTTADLDDKVTGFELLLVSPSREASWRFVVSHVNIGFEHVLGEGVGSTGYSGIVVGGEVGSVQSTGPAFSEVMKFPRKSMLLKKEFSD